MAEGEGARDARFHDADGRAIRLWATDAEDLQVISALCQDAVLPASEMRWSARRREASFLLNRFRWERGARRPERVRSVLTLGDVASVRGQGVAPGDADIVLSLLALEWEGAAEGAGVLRLLFAGDGVVEAACDCLDARLTDVTRPFAAPSGRAPGHPD